MVRIHDIDANWTSQKTSLCYVVSQWDQDKWHSYLDLFPQVKRAIDKGESRMKGWSLFSEDIFHRMYTVPQAIPYEDIPPEALWAHSLHQLLERSFEFGEMQLQCRNNKLAAGEATLLLLEQAIDLLPRPPQEFHFQGTVEEWKTVFVEIQSQITAREEARARLNIEMQPLTDAGQQQAHQQQIEQIDFDLKTLWEKLAEAEVHIGQVDQALRDYAHELGVQLAGSLLEAVAEAMQGLQDFLFGMSAFGWGSGMGMLRIPGNTHQKEAIAQRLHQDSRFRAIAEAAGRFQSIAALHQSAKRSKQIPEQFADTSLGNDLSRLIPTEWYRAAVEGLKTLFFKDYADEALPQSEFDGAVDDGQQGPIVICLDKSDSMNWEGGKKEIDSTGLLLALLSIAQEQKRVAYAILFDDKVRFERLIDPLKATPHDRIELADRCYNGGTNFMEPLGKALKLIESYPDLRKADVIFISDGNADVTDEFSEQWREAQKRLEFKVFTLIVGTYVNTEVLDKFSDRNIFVDNLDDAKVHEVFGI